MMLHHTGKSGGQRGTSAREDNLDYSIVLKSPTDYVQEDGCRFIVSFTKARVSQSGLPLIGDTEFLLQQGEGGGYVWTWRNVKKERKKDILRMLDAGMDYDTIKAALGCVKSYITKVKQEAIKAGQLTDKGKLTQAGTLYVLEE